MVVSEGAINNIMGGMENTTGVRLHSHRHKLKQRFDIVRKLGQGTYGKVQLALNKETKQQVAIKTIKKAKIETEQDLVRIRREIQIMSSVQHPQIIHIYEVFENREKMVLVMEYAAGGELYDYLSERKVLPEEEARRIFRQVASAVYYCHKHKICHRDLKLENILLDSDGNAKIADFGLSNVFDEKQRLDTFCGSPLYASPEIVKGVPYVGPEVDCWSLGVLLYTLVYGAMPFDGSNFRRLVKQITQGDFYEPSTPANASDLIRQMLTVQSTERANIADICNHWWVNEGYSECCLTLAEDLANQTPVRLDLLLSLVPKHISSEHMLIQPEDEDISQKSDSERGPPDLKIPPPPALDDESQMEPVPVRSHSLGAVLPSGGVSVDLLLEKKKKEREKKKKESTSKKPPSRPTNEEERKSKKKEDKLEEEKEKKKVKRVDSPSEREKEKIKKRDISNDREKAKKRERSSEREKLRKRDSSGERAKIRKKDASEEDLKKISESVISREEEKGDVKKADSGISLKTSVKKEKEEPVSTSKFSAKETEVEEEKVIDGLSSTQVKESKSDIKEVPKSLSSKSVSKSLSKSETSEKRSVTKKSGSKVGLVPEDGKDTEKILKETAAKIEKAESLIKKEDELVSPVSSSPLTSPVMSPPVTSPLVSSQNSSFATSPVRSRTGSESSTEAGRQTKSESSSRRQSKIFSKAALFEPSLSPQHSKSPPPQTDKPKKITTRPGALNMSDLTKRFEDKSSTEKKNKVVTPFKVSDTRKTFENKVEKSTPESSKHKTSVNSIGEVGQSSLKDSHPASPTKGDKSLVNSIGKASVPVTVKVANKSSRETSPTKKLSKSPTKESPPKDVSLVKKEKSPKKESSPVKTVPKPVSKISSFSKPKEEAPKEKKIEPPSEEIISKGKEAITTTKKVSEPRIPPTAKFDTSDSSESESEAEKMLRELSVKREKLEIAKKEKLKKVSEGKEAQISQNNISIMREDSSTATPAAHESSSSITSQPESRDQKYATLPRGFKSKTDQAVSHKPKVPLPKTSSIEESNSSEPVRKKSQVEIVLQTQNKQPTSHLDQGKRSSLAETQPQPSRSQFRTEIQRSIGTPEPKGPPPEPQLQRARRERIIPIMLEDDTTVNEYNNKMATSSRSSMVQPSSSSSSRNSSVSSVPRTIGFVVTPLSSTVNSTATADRKMNPSPPEPIRKSRRERIIPIAVEGEGLLTPPISESKSSEKVRPYQRQGSRGRGFTLDRAESFSSAGEDEEDEEEDGFQILTAESLFSTLLSRVRSLTRKMGEDGGRGGNIGTDRLKRGPLQPGINSDTPSSTGSSGTQSGFWSSLYSPPRELPGRTIPISRGQSREEDPFSVLGPPLWERSLSRNTSDSDSVFSEPSGPFSTLPRERSLETSLSRPAVKTSKELAAEIPGMPQHLLARYHELVQRLDRLYQHNSTKNLLIN